MHGTQDKAQLSMRDPHGDTQHPGAPNCPALQKVNTECDFRADLANVESAAGKAGLYSSHLPLIVSRM